LKDGARLRIGLEQPRVRRDGLRNQRGGDPEGRDREPPPADQE
jgi:hypothetical protein